MQKIININKGKSSRTDHMNPKMEPKRKICKRCHRSFPDYNISKAKNKSTDRKKIWQSTRKNLSKFPVQDMILPIQDYLSEKGCSKVKSR